MASQRYRSDHTDSRRERERKAVTEYVRGYQRYPETEDEIAFAESAIHQALAGSPWEEDGSASSALKSSVP